MKLWIKQLSVAHKFLSEGDFYELSRRVFQYIEWGAYQDIENITLHALWRVIMEAIDSDVDYIAPDCEISE